MIQQFFELSISFCAIIVVYTYLRSLNKSNQEIPRDQVPQPLPVTDEGLESFMQRIISFYNLPDDNDTRDSICTLIMHMPQSVHEAPLKFFGNSVHKTLANRAAYDKLEQYRAERKKKAQEQQTANESQPIQDKAVSTAV